MTLLRTVDRGLNKSIEPIMYRLMASEYYKKKTFSGLRDLLAYDEPDIEDIYCLTFSVTEDNYGEQKVVELKPDGANISVNQVCFNIATKRALAKFS